ncbi:MAG: T9SS type A sorting domain-containing protein, partial [Bacteroidia bacterium]
SLDGMNSAGQWRFAAKSTSTANTISSVTLTLCKTETVVVLASETFGLDNFTLYPNPNNGNFNIQFTSTSGNEIKVNVHDIRGREIFSKSYNNNGLFNESLQLNNVQSGVYLVTVQDGARKEVKKIAIQ